MLVAYAKFSKAKLRSSILMATTYSMFSCYTLINLFFFLHLIEKNALVSARELVVFHKVHHNDVKDYLPEVKIFLEELPSSEPYPGVEQTLIPTYWLDPPMGPSPRRLHQSSGRQTPPASTHLAAH
ncbi:hypothetical protein IEQ34_015770 [Dendrobium chrysotoxum]|uniref:Uncharacterized protein n=1 Tax=Dendrobium chrysotoxum TaxID=161865 RepID=A0AAV7GJD5_DENCH|nr:hypothetical protein IEQ34_015770 [Dendrobium chrysotoxum]